MIDDSGLLPKPKKMVDDSGLTQTQEPSWLSKLAGKVSRFAVKGIEAPLVNPVSSRFQSAGENVNKSVQGVAGKVAESGHPLAATGMSMLGDIGELTPQNMAINVGGEAIARTGLPKVAELFGKVEGGLTGTGGAVNEAFRAGKEGGKAQEALIGAMRGKVSESQVADDAMNALQQIKNDRGTAYRTTKEGIESRTFQKSIDTSPIKVHLDDLLDKYNISRSPDGTLDFSRTPINDTEANKVKSIAELVDKWGTQAGDDTVKGLDILKRKITDFYSPSSEARAFVTSLGSKVKKTITDAVPEYEGMVKGYEEASEAIKDISKELSLNPNASSATVMRKLKQTFRDNFDLRKAFVEKLDEAGNKNLMEQIAGTQLKEPLPQGLMKTVAGGDILAAIALGNPKILVGLPFTSPRLVGETALKAGQATRGLAPLLNKVPISTPGRIGLAASLNKKKK